MTRLSELVESARAANRAGRPEPEVCTLLVFPDPNTLIDLLESEGGALLVLLAWHVNDTRFVIIGDEKADEAVEDALDLNPPPWTEFDE